MLESSMAMEIERKFLVKKERLPVLPPGSLVKQGYLRTESKATVRARIMGERGYLTIKSLSSDDGLSRLEYEYEIPLDDAHAIIDGICDGGTVEKTRHEIPYGGRVWEVDVFTGANDGLVMAEVELERVDAVVDIPEWADREVTGDVRFYNSKLAASPWPEWGD